MAGHSNMGPPDSSTLGRSVPKLLSIGGSSEKIPNNKIDGAADLPPAYQVPLLIGDGFGGVEHSNGCRSGQLLKRQKPVVSYDEV
jgi:hypothetical protein